MKSSVNNKLKQVRPISRVPWYQTPSALIALLALVIGLFADLLVIKYGPNEVFPFNYVFSFLNSWDIREAAALVVLPILYMYVGLWLAKPLDKAKHSELIVRKRVHFFMPTLHKIILTVAIAAILYSIWPGKTCTMAIRINECPAGSIYSDTLFSCLHCFTSEKFATLLSIEISFLLVLSYIPATLIMGYPDLLDWLLKKGGDGRN